jgi:threonine dehydratase
MAGGSVTAQDVNIAPAVIADLVDAAAVRLASVISRTPLQRSDRLSANVGAEVWLKREDLQHVRSYKLRGAYNLIVQLTDIERTGGVVCASAGNHGQGVAYACGRLRVSGRVYVPRTTPRQKRDRIRVLGGEWIELRIVGDTYDEAAAAAIEDSRTTGATLVPPFDDVRTIAGQGTVAVETLQQLDRPPDTIVVPVGGGGLIAGMAGWLAARHPEVTVLGAEPAGAACMIAALAAGRPVPLPELDGFVDGAAVRQAGALTTAILSRAIAARAVGKQAARPHRPTTVRPVDEGRVCSEMLELYQSDGIIAEPAGALATALLSDREALRTAPGSTIVCVVSGGNNDVSRYGEIIERSLIFEGLKHYFLVDFPQEPGALRRFLDEVLGPEDDITLFEYVKRNNRETGPALVGIEIGTPADLQPLLTRMAGARITVERVEPNSTLFRFLR